MIDDSLFLGSFPERERGAYLGSIAALATADRVGSSDEMEHLRILCEAAGLGVEQRNEVLNAAMTIECLGVPKFFSVLKNSQLRFAFISDFIEFAQRDTEKTGGDDQLVIQLGMLVNVNVSQVTVLRRLVRKIASHSATLSAQSYLTYLGLEQEMRDAGVRQPEFLNGVFGMAAPTILSSVLGKSNNPFQGDIFRGKGLGSIIGMLASGRGVDSTESLINRTTVS